jgi:hypothetical protein
MLKTDECAFKPDTAWPAPSDKQFLPSNSSGGRCQKADWQMLTDGTTPDYMNTHFGTKTVPSKVHRDMCVLMY